MKFAAIKGQMGKQIYYVTALTYEDICNIVSPVPEEFRDKEDGLKLWQDTITKNEKNAVDCSLNHPEKMLNAFVLGISGGKTEWYELDVQVEEYRTYCMGVLSFSGEETIFVIGGQQRLEDIKAAVMANPELKNEKVPVILMKWCM